MVERKVIPFSMVRTRSMHLQPSTVNENYTDYQTVERDIQRNRFESLNKLFVESMVNNNTANHNATDIVYFLSNENVKNSGNMSRYIREFTEQIIPSVIDLKSFKSVVESSSLEEEIKKAILSSIDDNMICSRILDNDKKICSRFNMKDYDTDCKYKDVKDVAESVCNKIDTYDMSLKKKFNIALEETLYLYDKKGMNVDKSAIVEGVVEYFLRENELLLDKDMNGIRNILDTNHFITKEDTNLVSYLYNEAVSFSDKYDILTEASKDVRVKKLIDRAKSATTVKKAKEVIKDIFKFIKATFVIAASITLAEVTLIISAMIAMIVNIGVTGYHLIKDISGERDRLKEAQNKLSSEEEIKRLKEVIENLNKEIDRLEKSNNQVMEAANILDQAIEKLAFSPGVFVIHEPDPEDEDDFAFNMIRDINKVDLHKTAVQESKKFADSADVSDLIKKYKADQNKSQGKLKATITRIFTKSPAQIIDETPKIFEFIRVFGIFALAAVPTAIGPALALVTFMADRFVTMTLKRKDADKVCDYFKKEKDKMEKKAMGMKNGDKKYDVEEYIQCLDKCIDQLENYRDSLYSEKELDRRNGYEEAANVDFSEKITVDEYMNTHHQKVCHFLDISIQLLRNEIIRRCHGISVQEYEMPDGKLASSVFGDMPKDTLIKSFCTPDGIINIPLFMIKESVLGTIVDKDLYITITDICSYVNQYLGDKCMVNNYNENGNIYIVFNYLQAIVLGELEPYCACEELKESTAYMNFFEEAVDELESHNPSTIVSELCKNIDSLVYEYDLHELINVLENSNLIYEEFIELLKDYKTFDNNFIINQNIDRALESYSNLKYNIKPQYSICESLMLSIDNISLLEEVAKESKKPNNKGNIIKNAKENAQSKVGKLKADMHNKSEMAKSKASEVSDRIRNSSHKAANTAALSAEVAKKKAANIGTKEKEVSRNIDISLSRLKKNIDNALTSNRREAIVKGSIVPSFSRIIKFAIGEGILLKINPGIAAISTIGILIRSKRLNDKERYLLMDEIETELNVVEKELEIADRDGDMKKYRNLLTFKKKLQREMQRLKYDMRIHPKPAALDPED